jgi:hypothetical protein
MPQTFGISAETESSWGEVLAEAHREFLLAFIERAQATEAAVTEHFLASRER